MGDFQSFVISLLSGNNKGVKDSFSPDFLNKSISENDASEKPIHLACKNGNIEIVKLFIDNNCDIEEETDNKWKPIHFACMNGHLNILKILIENECDIESEDNDKWRIIHIACWHGHLDIVKFLIEQNCNIESVDHDKWRPIHYACDNGHLDIVELLVMNRCEIWCYDSGGETPLDKARNKGYNNIVELLVNEMNQIYDCIKKNDDITFSQLYNSSIIMSTDMDSGLSFLETAIENNADKIIKYFLDQPIHATEILYMKNICKNSIENTFTRLFQECLVYKCLRDHHQLGFQMACTAEIVNGERMIIKSSFLDIAAMNGSYVMIEEVLKKCLYKREIWEHAKSVAFQNGYHQIIESISSRETLLRSRELTNFSILHTAVCDNDPDMIKYILDNDLADADSKHEIVGSSRDLANFLCYEKCIEVLDELTANT